MRDLLPEYALGVLGAEAAARVAAHVDACDACRAELALLGQIPAAMAIGVPRVDAAAIARALPRPAGGSRSNVRSLSSRWAGRRAWQYAAAAALVLVAGGGIVWRSAPVGEGSLLADSSRAPAVAAESAQSLASRQAEGGITFGGGLSDLSLEELNVLMGQMDSVRALPSVDPESVTPVIAINEGGKKL